MQLFECLFGNEPCEKNQTQVLEKMIVLKVSQKTNEEEPFLAGESGTLLTSLWNFCKILEKQFIGTPLMSTFLKKIPWQCAIWISKMKRQILSHILVHYARQLKCRHTKSCTSNKVITIGSLKLWQCQSNKSSIVPVDFFFQNVHFSIKLVCIRCLQSQTIFS